jgi:hypothetical protein
MEINTNLSEEDIKELHNVLKTRWRDLLDYDGYTTEEILSFKRLWSKFVVYFKNVGLE